LEGQQAKLSCLNLSGWDDSCKKKFSFVIIQRLNTTDSICPNIHFVISWYLHFATHCKCA